MAYNSWTDVKPQEGKQTLAFELMAEVDFMLAGGARGGGKSELLTMVPLMFKDDPYYRGIFFRRQYSEIMGANGLWQKAESMYPLFDASPAVSAKTWKFPSGAKQEFTHMFTESDKESHRGKGYSFVGFDEIDAFSKEQVTFLMTCLRSEANMDSFCVGTLNPNPDSWCLPLVEYYLKEDGLPDPDKVGHIRHFIVKDGDFIFGDSEEFFKENYPESVYVKMPHTGEEIYIRPKKFTYLFFNVFDNPALLNDNPVYLSELQNLPDHERDTQLWGNWYARPQGQSLWKRSWVRGENGERVRSYTDIPDNIKWFRGVDKGYSEPSEVYKSPDYTSISPKIGKDKDGNYWVVGEFHKDVVDDVEYQKTEKERIQGKFRKLAGPRDELVAKQALYDGPECSIVLSKDMGAGTTDHRFTIQKLVEANINVEEDGSPKNTPSKKLKDFQPFCNACYHHLVFIVEDSFNKQTLDDWYKNLENFDPNKKSNSSYKDDDVDSTSLAFSKATSARVHTVQKLSAITDADTIKKKTLS